MMGVRIAVIALWYLLFLIPTGFGQGRTPASEVAFELSSQVLGPWPTYDLGMADLDGDEDLDLVLPNFGGGEIVIYLNDGSGHFTSSGQYLPYFAGHGLGLADFDSDGDTDFFIASTSTTVGSALYLNNGDGYFTKSAQSFGDASMGVGFAWVADIDSDEDTDIIVEYYSGYPNRVYKNDGNGSFPSNVVLPFYCTDFADLDADGDLDAIECVPGSGYRIMKNNGTGSFYQSSFLPDASLLWGNVGFSDLDNDGDIDAVVTTGMYEEAAPTRILLNDGTGLFSFSGHVLADTYYGDMCLGDFNNDGHTDIVLTSNLILHQLYVNDGEGGYTWSEFGDRTDIMSTAPLVGDLNGDGLLDLVINNFEFFSTYVWFNRTQLSCCGIYTGGISGNANCSPDGKLTLSDISLVIDRVFISKEALCCEAAGNTDGSPDCKITLSDITRLIDAVYVSKVDPKPCMPECAQ